MSESILLWPILLPIAAALIVLVAGAARKLTGPFTLAVMLANLLIIAKIFNRQIEYVANWAGSWLQFELRMYAFSGFITLAAAAFAFLIALYCQRYLRDRKEERSFYFYMLLTLGLVNGAVLSNNLIVMLFFWEGLLVTLFGMISIGREGAWKTGAKAFIIVGIADLCLLLGVTIVAMQTGTLTISKIHIPAVGFASVAMLLMMFGALAKGGAMPFHSWIPDAANDAPLPFMAFIPGCIEKLVGIYFAARISLDIFEMKPESWLSMTLMIVGTVTILLAVLMALVQRDYKRLLSYHAISQVGYMVLGIGTAVPIGIVGGLFHMLNNAMYKSTLFLTAGAVEKQAGTTNLEKLGGLARKMPVTFGCFLLAALAISGVPPFNGFVSKELLYDAAKERHIIFYLGAVIGSFFTAASFLKLGHAAYFGKRAKEHDNVKEAPISMLIPMIIIAVACLAFGIWNALPLDKFIQPSVADRIGSESFSGWHFNAMLVAITVIVLAAAVIHHLIGTKIHGSGLKAVDHIHYAPVAHAVYQLAEDDKLDPYVIGMGGAGMISEGLYYLDRGIDWLYDGASAGIAVLLSKEVRSAHNGSYATYVSWSLIGAAIVIWFLTYVFK